MGIWQFAVTATAAEEEDGIVLVVVVDVGAT